ncbi:glycoside hydrolase superfamily [Pholiota molesta]|nr:glycoside hydrolase superfamily [Pholiota molesta]
MKSALLATATTILLAGSTLASNHFAGLTVSNSASASTYTCRTQAEWNQVAKDAKSQGFNAIRLLAVDCNALDLASSAAQAQGIKIMAGIYISGTVAAGSAQVAKDVQTFVTAYRKYGAARYVGLTVGNEVNDSAANIMQQVNSVRSQLKSLGITTPVSTVHTWVMIRDNPTLCTADFVGANAHAFYNPGSKSSQAGSFVFKTAVPALKKKCPGKKIYITESGWPSRGPTFQNTGVASVTDEITAIRSLNCAAAAETSVSLFAFEYDDQPWKANDNERSFGVDGKLDLNGDVLAHC